MLPMLARSGQLPLMRLPASYAANRSSQRAAQMGCCRHASVLQPARDLGLEILLYYREEECETRARLPSRPPVVELQTLTATIAFWGHDESQSSGARVNPYV